MTETSPISQSILDSLWDFSDPRGSAERFRSAADGQESDAVARAELETQEARALGILGDYDEANALLDAALEHSGESERVQARVALERGRLLVAAERADESVPQFTLAARKAAAAASTFLALDALHMLALWDAGHEEEWAEEGLTVLETVTDARTRRWGVALHNNLGWHLHDSGRPEEALPHFELARDAAEAVGTRDQAFIGRWSIARCLRTLGRREEARVIQEELQSERPDDEFVQSELAELGAAAPTARE